MDPESIRTGERVPHGGEPDQSLLDFSANTNPQTPDGVEAVYADALEASRRYPDDSYADFRDAAAAFVGCDPAQIIPTPGGLAAIRLAMELTLEPGDEALVPAPSFGEYAREVHLQGATPRYIDASELLEVETDLLESCALAVVCTPNNPTGAAADPDALTAFAARCDDAETTLLVDEAFLGFTDLPSAATLEREHVIVARSLTKLFGLPGLRAGFAVAYGEQRDALETARRAWSLGTPAARVGAYCLRQEAFVRETRDRVASERARVCGALETECGFDVDHSDAPYLLCDVGERSVTDILASAREAGVVIRDATTFPGLESHIRVAIKDRDANDELLAALGAEMDGNETNDSSGGAD
ncbi:pyridoxal phosphate-dependent class II aminotransferase [Natronolimnobius sp. AArcel1]|uniref:aminotransferase class I/II-fold pyridoxal phosphate-dependent enzyme n=1 Tax=Natronolimnobius sp. AArcel1 TaxID=1679093 RepID=UPI0013EDD14D|nr:aminotransferase class I/II-fold pyridoxal phosphate-dependent enzyme [Natronolimnobius sp. AArcel1]NGM67891.1 pyridoxal phosphate-dependent class II aminotransferase [Natronolimnobius sp. AArcel1]